MEFVNSLDVSTQTRVIISNETDDDLVWVETSNELPILTSENNCG